MLEPIKGQRLLVVATALVLVVGGALAGVGTYAYLTDTDSSTSNTIDSGTMDLTLDGTNNGVSSSFTLSGAGPGDTVSHTYDIRNVGSKSADHVEVVISATEKSSEASEPADSDLDTELGNVQTQQQIEVVTYEYQDDAGNSINNLLSGVSDSNGNGIVDLAEVINQTGTADGLAAPQKNSGNTTKLAVKFKIGNDDGSLTGDSDEDLMADGVAVKIDFTLNEDGSQ